MSEHNDISAESCDLQTLLEVRDFLQDISTGADVTDASRDSATEFVALLDAEYAEKWEGSDGEPSNGKQPLMASRPAPPVPSDHTFSVAQSVGMRDPNEIAFELCEKWQKSKLDVYRNRTFSLDEISAFMSGVLAVLASQPSPAATVECPTCGSPCKLSFDGAVTVKYDENGKAHYRPTPSAAVSRSFAEIVTPQNEAELEAVLNSEDTRPCTVLPDGKVVYQDDTCECPKCGRMHRSLGFGKPPSHIRDVPQTSRAITDIATERQRQVSAEGWTLQHDDSHISGEMAMAAAVYALTSFLDTEHSRNTAFARYWPWDRSWFKPAGGRHDLVRAAALIVAEIERLDRASSQVTRPEHS